MGVEDWTTPLVRMTQTQTKLGNRRLNSISGVSEKLAKVRGRQVDGQNGLQSTTRDGIQKEGEVVGTKGMTGVSECGEEREKKERARRARRPSVGKKGR